MPVVPHNGLDRKTPNFVVGFVAWWVHGLHEGKNNVLELLFFN